MGIVLVTLNVVFLNYVLNLVTIVFLESNFSLVVKVHHIMIEVEVVVVIIEL